MSLASRNTLVLLAGGSGSRMRGTVADKVLTPMGRATRRPALLHSLNAFFEAGVVGRVVIVTRDATQREAIAEALVADGFDSEGVIFAQGGAERRDSVLAGLDACPPDSALVFIHDGARPLVRAASLRELTAVATRTGAAVLAHRVTDTIKQAPAGATPGEPVALRDLDRSSLWAMETPQVFAYEKIHDAYRRAATGGAVVTDDVAVAELAGLKVALVENLFPNPKITGPADISWCEHLMWLQCGDGRRLGAG